MPQFVGFRDGIQVISVICDKPIVDPWDKGKDVGDEQDANGQIAAGPASGRPI
jgi:hypothetical protein